MTTHSAKRTQLAVALAVLFLLLLGLATWMEFGKMRPTPHANANIESIIIKRTGHADITLVKTDSIWKMTTPYELIADSQRIEPLLSLGTASFNGYDQTEVDMSATGLSAPDASIIIGEREFLLGESAADGERRYALIDQKVNLIPEWVWSLVHGGVSAFSDLTVFTQLPKDVFLIKGGDILKLANVEQWASLQADRVSAWSDDFEPLEQARNDDALWQLTATETPGSVIPLATLLRLEDRTLINTKPGFAFVISNERLESLIN